ncbi:RsmD family RNA methyltransferase [Pseudofulvibacter geojedonensis]|uniref:RsmD family RNA methyltransferase n=1 Tax=Pseudofulvibacter geojedonensis TaxID=1123758 RepID=A0ABW3HY23_9FLAO
MRIISGKHKGRRLVAPKKLPVRPTTDFAKEALFNILNNDFCFPEISLLDLFSGTGNISYEFASRGCSKITAVDADYSCTSFIKKTARELDFDITCLKSDVYKFLEKWKTPSTIVFADPPYDFSDADFAKIPELIFSKNLLLSDGYLIIEHSKHTNLEKLPYYSFSKSYGGCTFSFFEHTVISSEEE